MSATLGGRPWDNESEFNANPGITDLILAPLRLERKTLVVAPYKHRTTRLAITLIVFSALLDLTGIEGVNIRFNFTVNGNLTLLHLFSQPIILFYSSFLIKKAVQLMGNSVTTEQAFRLVGLAQVWTVVSWCLSVLLAIFSIQYSVLHVIFLFLTGSGYFLTLIIGLTSARAYGDYITAFFFIAIYLIIGLFLPLYLISLLI